MYLFLAGKGSVDKTFKSSDTNLVAVWDEKNIKIIFQNIYYLYASSTVRHPPRYSILLPPG